MVKTERLYHSDSYLREFTARVVEIHTSNEGTEVVLDRTAFYPEGGGQPSDLGLLGGVPVVEVVERAGLVVHRLRGQLPVATEVQGQIDWQRRFDHMQQHSGQHLLSQAFERVAGASTVSFHIGTGYSTIDLAVPSLAASQVEEAERLANQVVFEDRPILVHLLEPSDLSRFNLRKGTDRSEDIRVVEVQDFDAIPCGGTHCRSTGEVGLVKVTRWEHRGGNSRVQFLCGGRALRDYQAKNDAIVRLAAMLRVREQEVHGAVERVLRESSESRREADQLKSRLLDYQAEELAREGQAVGPASVVVALLADSGPDDLKHLAMRLSSRPSRVALLASAPDCEKPHLVFARSEDLGFDATAILRRVCTPLGGRCGGRSNLAQGGLPEPGKVGSALEAVLAELRSVLAV